MLDPDNKDIKIDDKSGPVAKLYLERDMLIQLEQVILGLNFLTQSMWLRCSTFWIKTLN